MRRRIADERVITLIRRFLNAGYLEDWKFHRTYSGTAQGGILSPLLSNIFAHQLDVFMEEDLKANRTQTCHQKNARRSPEYRKIENKITRLRRKLAQTGDKSLLPELKELEQGRKGVPRLAKDKRHPGKLKYVRYADDTLILVYGTKQEAVEIKQNVSAKLSEMGLTLSDEKTKLTHWDEAVRFLGYEIRGTEAKRGVGIRARLKIPREKLRGIREGIEGVCGYHQIPEADLLMQVSLKYQGFCHYYKYATGPQKAFNKLARETWWATARYLASKHRCSIKQMLTSAQKSGRYATITRGERRRKTFRTFCGKREVVLGIFPPATGYLNALTNPQDWKVDLLPVAPGNWQSGRSLATRLEALDRSKGVCEQCKVMPVAQVHHTAPLRKKRSVLARVMSDQSQKLTARALCKSCHLGTHMGSYRSEKGSSGRFGSAGCGERRSPSAGTAT